MLKFGLLSLIDPIIQKLERSGPYPSGKNRLGRKRTYSTWLLVRLWLLAVLDGWSVRQLFLKLANPDTHAYLSRFVSLPTKLPNRTTFGRRASQSDFLAALQTLFAYLARRLVLRHPGDLRIIVLDFTDLPVRRKYDPEAAYGHTSKGPFYGYKLHLVVNSRGGLLSYRLATANHHSLRLAEEMLPDLKPFCRLIQFLLGDSGYDSKLLHDLVARDLDARLLAPANPRWQKTPPKTFDLSEIRGRDLAFLYTPRGRRLFRRRTIIEQVNGQLKDVFRVAQIPYYIHGGKAVERLVVARLILYNLALLHNVQAHQTHIRRVKSLVA
jgi:hypothetical protein